MTTEHYCVICGDEALVGVGNPPRWLCMDHFSAHMKIVGDRVAELRKLERRDVDDYLDTTQSGG